MKRYLDRSESLEVDIEELEKNLLGPNEQDVDIRYLALQARGSSSGAGQDSTSQNTFSREEENWRETMPCQTCCCLLRRLVLFQDEAVAALSNASPCSLEHTNCSS